MRIVCQHHTRPHRIALFANETGGWREVETATASRRREQRALTADQGVRRVLPGDRTGHARFLRGPQPVDLQTEFLSAATAPLPKPLPDPVPPLATFLAGLATPGMAEAAPDVVEAPSEREAIRVTYDLTCERCKRRNTHATFVRREDRLFPLLDLLEAAGRTEVTVSELVALATHWDAQQSR